MHEDYESALDDLIRELAVIDRTGSMTAGPELTWSHAKARKYAVKGSPLHTAVCRVESFHDSGLLPYPRPRLAWGSLWRTCVKSPKLSAEVRMKRAWKFADRMLNWAMEQKAGIGVNPSKPNAALPVLHEDRDPTEVDYNGRTFVIEHPDCVQVIRTLNAAFPRPTGLTKVVEHHPNRVIERLPQDLQDIIETTQAGSCWAIQRVQR